MNSALGQPMPQQHESLPRFRIRIWFRKEAALRFLGHHDLARAFERFFRRAGIPLACTTGFHPKAKIVFALSLPLGVIGNEEIVDVELQESPDLARLLPLVEAHIPPGLTVLRMEEVEGRKCPAPRGVVYKIPFEPRMKMEVDGCARAFLESPVDSDVWMTHRDNRTVKNLRSMVRNIEVFLDHAEVSLIMNDQGTAKPSEIIRLLGLEGRMPLDRPVERLRIETD